MLLKGISICLAAAVLCGATGCYQVHSDDDLRTIPVTNNPNIIPKSPMQSPMQGIPTSKI